MNKMNVFSQMDLSQDDIAILDVKASIYLWIGSKSEKQEQEMALECLKKFL